MKTLICAAFALFVGQMASANCEPQLNQIIGSEIDGFGKSVTEDRKCCAPYGYQSIEWYKCVADGGSTGC